MEDSPLLILFFIIYLIAGSLGKKKSKKQSTPRARRQPMRTRSRGEQHDARAMEQDRQTMAGFEAAFSGEQAKHDLNCAQASIHLHEVLQMDSAAEGEDPCHFGGKNNEKAEADDAWQEADEAQEAFRRDVLRGVIMSEILTRPQQCRAWQRSRREYHG